MTKSTHKLNVASIYYDDQLDILELHTAGKVHHSLPINDAAVLHFNGKNKLVGLELTGLAHIQEIPKEHLAHIASAHITIRAILKKTLYIGAILMSRVNNQDVPTVLSLPAITTR